MVFPCDEGISRSTINEDLNNFMPRLGFAYDITGDAKTVVRGGWGRFYAVSIMNILQDGSVGIPFGLRESESNRAPDFAPASIQLANPWASVEGGNPFPFVQDPTSLAFPGSTAYTVANPNLVRGYFEQFNLSLQRQVGDSTVVELAYVGNRGHDLIGNVDVNLPVSSPDASRGNVNDRRPLIGEGIRALNVFDNVIESWYDSLQVRVQRRFANNFSYLASYTYGKATDYQTWHASSGYIQDHRNPAADKGRGDNDRRHLLSLSWLWQLPLGFEFNGIVQYYSGRPFRIYTGSDNNFDGISGNDRPDQVAAVTLANPSNEEIRNGATWFNTGALVPNQPNQPGNFERNSISGPGYKNVNLGLSYNLNIKDRHRFQLRLEAFNVFNWVNFGEPEGELGASDFGQITSAGSARIMQLGVKYSF
jgi:hypothetical protein